MKFNGIKINWFFYIFLLSILPAIFGITYRIVNYYLINLNPPVTGERLGQLGDYIGGLLNPILTFFSFLALLITIIIQNKQLDVSTTELKTASDTLKENQKVMSEQLLTQSLQQFDSIFFAMLKDLNSLLYEIEHNINTDKQPDLELCYKLFHNEYNFSASQIQEQILNHRSISRYFMLLFQVLKIIEIKLTENQYIEDNKKPAMIKMYSNIVRASVSEKAMQLLMINALNDNFKPFKNLIEKFNFFEHTSFKYYTEYSIPLINAAFQYTSFAFDKSMYWNVLKQSNLFGNFIINSKINTRNDLYEYILKYISIDKRLYGPFGDNIFSGQSYFCNLKTNSEGQTIGFLVDNLSFRPIRFGIFDNNKFRTYSDFDLLKIHEDEKCITISPFRGTDYLVKIYFHDNCSITTEISDLINEL
ncbi:putative phage abortive infection protein [Acinetobacter guillouiae]|uniref:putative phage abortive infection protein n=1 Tax=Acinetobacter guillouiae TaxID=106649 RepID=UPI003AF75AC8